MSAFSGSRGLALFRGFCPAKKLDSFKNSDIIKSKEIKETPKILSLCDNELSEIP